MELKKEWVPSLLIKPPPKFNILRVGTVVKIRDPLPHSGETGIINKIMMPGYAYKNTDTNWLRYGITLNEHLNIVLDCHDIYPIGNLKFNHIKYN